MNVCIIQAKSKNAICFYFFRPIKYDIIPIMKRIILAILLLGVAGCTSGAYHDDGIYVESEPQCVGDCSVAYATPNGNDLKLETAHHVIHMQSAPNKQYAYYVWSGDKEYTDDPDIIVENGEAMVLVAE